MTPVDKAMQSQKLVLVERRVKAVSTDKVHTVKAPRILARLVLGGFFVLGAAVTGGLANLLFSGWVVIIAALFGGVWGMSVVAFCQASGRDVHEVTDQMDVEINQHLPIPNAAQKTER